MGNINSFSRANCSQLFGICQSARPVLAGALLAALAFSSAQANVPASSFEGGGNFAINNTDYNYGSDNIQIGLESSGNTLTLTNSTLTTTGGLYLGAERYGARDNKLLINGGSNITVGSLNFTLSESKFSKDMEIHLSGPGTSLTVTSGNITSCTTGDFADFTADNSGKAGYITISDGALLKMDKVWNYAASKPYFAAPIRMDGGFYAVKGDVMLRTSDKSNFAMGIFTYWDTEQYAWVYASNYDYDEFNKHFSVVYYETEEEGYAATGHWGLGGYTVVGLIPEPATYVAIFGLFIAGFTLVRRKRK